MRFKFSVIVFFVVGVALNLVGCGSLVSSTVAVDNSVDAASRVVADRAQQRWNALLKQDMEAAYQFISPGGRSVMTAQQYGPRINTVFWRGAKVDKASCAAETCEVTVLVDMVVERVKFTNPITETWILDAGKWWFVYKG